MAFQTDGLASTEEQRKHVPRWVAPGKGVGSGEVEMKRGPGLIMSITHAKYRGSACTLRWSVLIK